MNEKPHYLLLDALRGVAAILVMCYHVFEAYATNATDQHFNHGYLAVDFFFLLSGFVISYAYDDRWKTLTTAAFLRRRLIRLHPMVIIGVTIGVASFLVQGSERWDGSHVALSAVALAAVLNLLLLPAFPGTECDVRGNNEMFPLNGPHWSLFFEYIGNVAYALLIRRLSTRALSIVVAALGLLLLAFATGGAAEYGHIGYGWSLAGWGFPGGLLRMLFSYSLGMLMARTFRPTPVRHAFWICTAILAATFSLPHVGAAGTDAFPLNGFYDVVCLALVFPLVVQLGASAANLSSRSSKFCTLLGEVSYPVYAIHYPFMYLFYSWVWTNTVPFSQSWPVALAIIAGSLVLALIVSRCYDRPVRRWLTNHFATRIKAL